MRIRWTWVSSNTDLTGKHESRNPRQMWPPFKSRFMSSISNLRCRSRHPKNNFWDPASASRQPEDEARQLKYGARQPNTNSANQDTFFRTQDISSDTRNTSSGCQYTSAKTSASSRVHLWAEKPSARHHIWQFNDSYLEWKEIPNVLVGPGNRFSKAESIMHSIISFSAFFNISLEIRLS